MEKVVDDIILNALHEDMPTGDITTDNLIPEDEVSSAKLISKDNGVISGILVFKRVFELLDPRVKVDVLVNDGDKVVNKQLLATLNGPTRAILKGERTALNLMQRMSGIATQTAKCVEQCVKPCEILDTRKTAPNLRFLDKKAVVDGGGTNHRYCLSDMVMIKDNHIDACGSITAAVKLAKEKTKNVKIEVEVENIDELNEALATEADIIMLDNMTSEMMAECVKINNHSKKLEASGNMTLERIREVSSLGVDYISIGALTHSVKCFDISLKFH
ncbi:MAG: carboxylating nicotinate-nucleotide diphosphorylase [Acholeplasmatales bacterium]|nr:carboxylating nicotinate-nucleotide diphosphorylase [Acholeplasmatales bacterium]